MTIYFITAQTGLQWTTEADSELDALADFDQRVGIDPNNIGLEKILEQGDLVVEAIYNLDDLLDMIKTCDIDDQTMSDLPTFGGDIPSDTTHIWSWDEDRLLIGTCSEDYEIVTRKEWSEL